MSASGTVELRYTERGAGAPVVLLHGFPLDRTMWDDQVPVLAERFRVIVPDLRGHGETAAPAGPYTMAQHVEDVRALLGRLQIARAALVGLSMGGYITLNLLGQYPELLSAAVLADTRAEADSEDALRGRAEQARLVRAEGMEPFIRQQLPKMYAPTTLRDRPERIERYRQIVGRNRPEAVAAQLTGLAERPDTTPILGRIRCSVLVIVGSEDTITPPADAMRLAEGIPGARLETIQGAGHLANIEAPERFNAALMAFLTSALG